MVGGERVVRQLSIQLQALHRILLMSEATALSLGGDPYRLMGAAMGDPRLAWLQPLLKLIVGIDEADDAGSLEAPADLAACRARVEALLYGEGGEGDLAARLGGWTARSPAIAELDRRLRQTLAAMPEPSRH